jgi:hypothetical protein
LRIAVANIFFRTSYIDDTSSHCSAVPSERGWIGDPVNSVQLAAVTSLHLFTASTPAGRSRTPTLRDSWILCSVPKLSVLIFSD